MPVPLLLLDTIDVPMPGFQVVRIETDPDAQHEERALPFNQSSIE